MQSIEVVKAWKDESYRDTLTLEQRANLPAHPSGIIDFDPEIQEEGSFEVSPIACGHQTGLNTIGCCIKRSLI